LAAAAVAGVDAPAAGEADTAGSSFERVSSASTLEAAGVTGWGNGDAAAAAAAVEAAAAAEAAVDEGSGEGDGDGDGVGLCRGGGTT